MSWLAVKLDKNFEPIEIGSEETSGLAHQVARRFTDDGFRARVIPPEDSQDVAYLFDQVMQRREMGFVRESGHVPNGDRAGNGCRTVGNMIYPAFGGMLEGSGREVTSSETSQAQPLPPTLSSKDFENVPGKIVVHMRKNGLN